MTGNTFLSMSQIYDKLLSLFHLMDPQDPRHLNKINGDNDELTGGVFLSSKYQANCRVISASLMIRWVFFI